ncbi:MAG: hypothetical protein WCF90_00585 [Methanomicrobiales archaeon]
MTLPPVDESFVVPALFVGRIQPGCMTVHFKSFMEGPKILIDHPDVIPAAGTGRINCQYPVKCLNYFLFPVILEE